MAEKGDENSDALDDAAAVQVDAARLGFDWNAIGEVLAKAQEELDELRDAIESGDAAAIRGELGDLLFTAVNLARFLEVSPRAALRESTQKFTNRFGELRAEVSKTERNLKSYSLDELDLIWERIKVRAEQGLDEGG